MLETVTAAMLAAREGLLAEFLRLHRRMLAVVRADAVCRRLMTVPGVGALVSITSKATADDPGRFRSSKATADDPGRFRSSKATADDPGRFRSSKAVGAHFGLTPKRHQSGE